MRVMRRTGCLAILAAAALAACGGSADGPGGPPSARITVAGGDSQTADVGWTLPQPIVVLVTEAPAGARGSAQPAPLPGMTVSFHVIDPGCGYPDLTTATTDSAGHATMPWTLGYTARVCRMLVSSDDRANGLEPGYDTAFAFAQPDTGRYLVLWVGDSLRDTVVMHAGDGRQVHVTYRDIYGNLDARCYGVDTTLSGPVAVDRSDDITFSLTGVDTTVATLHPPAGGAGTLPWVMERASVTTAATGVVRGVTACPGAARPGFTRVDGTTATVTVRFLP